MRLFVAAMLIHPLKQSHNPLLVPVFSRFLEWEINVHRSFKIDTGMNEIKNFS